MAEKNASAENTEIKIGAKLKQVVHCSQCQKEAGENQYYTYKDKKGQELFLCDACRAVAEQAFQEETLNPNMGMALAWGIGAALVAGAVWFGISVVTGFQIGYLAIGVGFLIGHAVMIGSGKKRGAPLQIMSALMTVVTLLISQYFIELFYIRKYLLAHKTEYPGYAGEWIFVSPFSPDVLKDMFSPMGLLIWGIGIYFAYSIPKSRSV